MNETTKKVLLAVVVVVAVLAAIIEGVGFARGPQLQPVMNFGGSPPGQGMKAKEKALQDKGKKAAESSTSTTPPSMGNAAGDIPPPGR